MEEDGRVFFSVGAKKSSDSKVIKRTIVLNDYVWN